MISNDKILPVSPNNIIDGFNFFELPLELQFECITRFDSLSRINFCKASPKNLHLLFSVGNWRSLSVDVKAECVEFVISNGYFSLFMVLSESKDEVRRSIFLDGTKLYSSNESGKITEKSNKTFTKCLYSSTTSLMSLSVSNMNFKLPRRKVVFGQLDSIKFTGDEVYNYQTFVNRSPNLADLKVQFSSPLTMEVDLLEDPLFIFRKLTKVKLSGINGDLLKSLFSCVSFCHDLTLKNIVDFDNAENFFKVLKESNFHQVTIDHPINLTNMFDLLTCSKKIDISGENLKREEAGKIVDFLVYNISMCNQLVLRNADISEFLHLVSEDLRSQDLIYDTIRFHQCSIALCLNTSESTVTMGMMMHEENADEDAVDNGGAVNNGEAEDNAEDDDEIGENNDGDGVLEVRENLARVEFHAENEDDI